MKQTAKKHLLNTQIKFETVDIVGADGGMQKNVPIREALSIARNQNLDLVQLNGNAVCKLMDYNKFLYEQNKKNKKSATVQMKEIKLRPCTDEGDINTKANNINKFLSKRHDVKIVVQFRGREQAHKEIGFEMIQKILGRITQNYDVKQQTALQGRTISTVIKAA